MIGESINKTLNICNKEKNARSHECIFLNAHALPRAVRALSIVYILDLFQSMLGDEPNSEIPLC